MIAYDSVLPWLGLLCMLKVTLVARLAHGSWTHPSVYFCAIWLATVTPGVAAAFAPLEPMATIIPALFLLAFLLGTLSIGPARASLVEEGLFSTQFLGVVVLLFGICGVVAAVSYAVSAFPPGSALLDPATWADIALRYSVDRYAGTETEPLAVRVLISFNFAGAILGGVLVAVGGGRYVKWAALPVVAGVAITLLTTAKAVFLICSFGALAGWLSAERLRSRDNLDKRNAWALSIAGFMAVAVFVGAQAIRYETSSGAGFALLMERLQGYVTGQLYAFSAWVRLGGAWNTEFALGRYTFAGIFDFLGLYRRAGGVYEFIALKGAAPSSNVFTAFRGLIQDFTLPGALFLTVILGTTTQFALRWASGRFQLALCTAFLVAIYFFIGWSHVISVFVYNTTILAIGLVTVVLLLAVRPSRGEG